MNHGLAPSFNAAYRGQRVLLTGHTGFKGAWLSEWLLELGANVTGFSLPPPTDPALFSQLGLAQRMRHLVGDVREAQSLRELVREQRPDYVFHLAAQPLVRQSYVQPLETYETNVMGTAHVLEAARLSAHPCVVIIVTTDKCYENREWMFGYREEDALGGYDPYSSSKAAAELVTAGYRRSFFKGGAPVAVASARAGNVIGGGDWAVDRIIPDCMRALARREVIPVRNPGAIRPWQHVLEPLGGYLLLAARLREAQLAGDEARLAALGGPFNFGPVLASNRTVATVTDEVLRHWPGRWVNQQDKQALHEAGRLALAIDKAQNVLGWSPSLSFAESVALTVTWYRSCHQDPASARAFTLRQIRDYMLAMERGEQNR